ncbi:Uma2 family endonuclease [Hufsiella arboris]|uniref:Uma2 family endonuclease n=1 Tax=Hufsiella arboris TaxID=2695275 RepID=UPI001F45FAA6|nr:Uma2 family endonuclease [Hufsiella arboris]
MKFSPHSNNSKELKNKYEVYEQAGVKEYWIIHPVEKTFMKYLLVHGSYQPSRLFTLGDVVSSSVLYGLELQLDELFVGLIDY